MQSRTYTRTELQTWHAELECYRVKRTTKSGEELSWINFDQYLVDQKACVRRVGDYAPAIRDIKLFETLNEKWEQLRDMLNKRAYAKSQELKELAAMQ